MSLPTPLKSVALEVQRVRFGLLTPDLVEMHEKGNAPRALQLCWFDLEDGGPPSLCAAATEVTV